MKTFSSLFTNLKKEKAYDFYCKIINKPKKYENMTRKGMLEEILNVYYNDPEIIFDLCTMEEIQILKHLLEEDISVLNHGFIEFLLFQELKDHYLIIEENNFYHIPTDLINYIKMAFNLYDEQKQTIQDVVNNLLLGFSRIYNVLKLEEIPELFQTYSIFMELKDIKKFIRSSMYLKDRVSIIKYQNKEYMVSLEYFFYKDVLELKDFSFPKKIFDFVEVISIGKYKINLIEEKTFQFLNFLESHFRVQILEYLIDEIMIYAGFDLNDVSALKKITGQIPQLFEEVSKVIAYFPVWIYSGNILSQLNEPTALPKKNDPCPCGSGKKYKHCCGK